MNWTYEALAMIQGAPRAVQSMIRGKVESAAREAGLDMVTVAFVSTMMRNRKHGQTSTGHGKVDLSSLYANTDGDPLTSAFEATNEVHVFAGGEMLPPEPTHQAWTRAEQSTPPAGRSRSLYIHIPFCESRCVFCPFYANRSDAEAVADYVRVVATEIRQLGQTPLGQSPFHAVYFGGGTPSDLSPAELTLLLETIGKHLTLAEDAEVTLEGRIAGHDPELTEAALTGKVNRFSVGVQSFSTDLRRSLGRKASRAEAIELLNRLAETPAAVVIDLIFGLPGQSMKTWQDDLHCLHDETAIHGVDLYQLKSMPGSVMGDLIAKGALPPKGDLATRAGMFAEGVATMQSLGWDRLSIAHWGRDPRERSRYNSLVKSGADCVPIGCGAGGRVGLTRFFQTSDLETYLAEVDAGRKPVASGIQLAPSSVAVDCIISELEQGLITPLHWVETHAQGRTVGKLLAQWAGARLLAEPTDGTYRLTTAGEFWAVPMASRLARLVQQMTAGDTRPRDLDQGATP